MVKKTLLIILVLVGLLFCPMIGICFADAAADFEQAEGHRKNGDYVEAEEIYETIITDYPSTEEALYSQRGLVMVYILTKRSGDARMALDELTTDFVDYPEPNAVAEALFDIARQYEWSARYKEANKIFQRIMDEYPNSWYVNRADLAVVRTNIMYLIELGKDQEAQTAIDKLIANFPEHPDLPQAIYNIAKRHEWSHKYQQANSVYLELVQRYPESPYAGKVPLNVPRANVLSLIDLGQDTEAQAAIGRLVSDFSENPSLPEALDNIARKYEWTHKYEKARSVYQQIIQQYPGNPYAGTAQLEVSKVNVLLLIESGEDSEAQTALDNLIADFNDYHSLASAVSRIAEQYQFKAFELEKEGSGGLEEIEEYLSKAIAIWEIVINEFQDPIVVPQVCCYVGDCYRKLGEYDRAIECYQKVIDDYPGNSMAWHALFMTGRSYEDLKESGLVSKSQADSKTKAAYKQLLEKYPKCPAAKIVRRWLNRHNSR